MRVRARGYILLLTVGLCGVAFAILLASSPGQVLFRGMIDDYETERARDAAASTHEAAISGLMDNPNMPRPADDASSKTPDLQTISLTFPQDSATGSMTFKKGNDPYSTGNYKSTTSTTGWDGRVVPPYQVHLVSVGKMEGREHRREALVRPFYEYLYEDFNADGQGSKPRLTWIHMVNNKGYLCTDSYMFLGSQQLGKNMIQLMQTGKDSWEDYSLEAHVAFYGNANFGFCFRTKASFDGYVMQINPEVGLEKITGMDFGVAPMFGGVIPDKHGGTMQNSQDPVITATGGDLTSAPAEWTLRVSVHDSTAQLAVYDKGTDTWTNIGTQFDLTALSNDLETEGFGSTFTSGGVGFWVEETTALGVTNVIVRKIGEAQIYIPSQWSEG